ncbi:endothelin-converting enzyme 1-like isoform X2 [Prorops nasuta]|uniref:endothelin-converting enzyme 1-like isoform X2 n=1 Tax=Prorops nasuta TaxID=863751 RepID=UPI0034CFE554
MRKIILLIIVTLVVNDAMNPEDKAFHHDKKTQLKFIDLCTDEKCIKIAKALTASMDPKVDPCENFYLYMCGGWIKNNPIPPGDHHISTSKQLLTSIYNTFKDFLKDKSKHSVGAFDKAEKLHSQCMQKETIDKQGIKPLVNLLEKVGQWPLLYQESAIKEPSTWQEPHAKAIKELLEPSSLFTVGVLIPDDLAEKRIIELSSPKPIFLKKNPNLKSDYKKYVMDVGRYMKQTLKNPSTDAQMKKDIKDMLKFEMALAEIITPEEELENDEESSCQMSVKGFQKQYDVHGGKNPKANIDWLNVFNLYFNQAGIKIEPTEEIAITDCKFFEKLPKLLQRTDTVTIVNYIYWCFIYSMKFYSDSTLIEIDKKSMSEYYPDKFQDNPREARCFEQAKLQKVASHVLIEKLYPPTAKKIEKIFHSVTEAIKHSILKTKWMDEDSKEKSVRKLEVMVPLIGYPEGQYTPDALNSYYESFVIGSSYMHSALNLLKFRARKEMERLRQRSNRLEWTVEPTYDNDFYQPATNTITMPAASLQSPVFDVDFPYVLNWAGIGTTIGHEASHAFDVEGRKYDHRGKEVKRWWSKVIDDIYIERVKCFKKQFGKYVIRQLTKNGREIKTDGELTASENIADLIGLQAAYNAFKVEQKLRGGKDIRLKSLEKFTADQLFFMYYASIHCSNSDEQQLLKDYLTDEHATDEVRIIGAIANTKDFGEIFNCTRGMTVMNPKEKCSIFKRGRPGSGKPYGSRGSSKKRSRKQ